jgi:tetratricopeptide (TPR) repeat protein
LALAYYTSSTNSTTDGRSYIKEVDDLNATKLLPFLVMVGNKGLTPSDEQLLNRHFASIENYNSYIASHEPRAIDYFGRAMDYVTLRNYAAAITDLDRAIALTPDFAMAYFLRGVARNDMLQIAEEQSSSQSAGIKMELRSVISDFDRAAELSPRNAYAHYNKGNALVALGDYTSALAAYRKAIELKADFGEAYYNLAYVYFQLGNRQEGASNLSKAGELGVVPSYNLLKRMH